MQPNIEGIYRNGKIELSEVPSDMCEGARVVVSSTSLEKGKIENENSNVYGEYLERR